MEVFAPPGGSHAIHEAKRSGRWPEVEGAGATEAFRVDDLLDFSSDEIGGSIGEDDLQASDESADSSVTVAEQAGHNAISAKPDDPIPDAMETATAADLCVACEEVAELEWLSTFVEDSFSADKSLASALLAGGATTSKRASLPVPGRARTKRSRATPRVWSSRLLPSTSCRPLDYAPPRQALHPFHIPEAGGASPYPWGDKPSKARRRKGWQDAAAASRRCSHCLTQRTPQWRAGPLGAKTLCNACGVRFKSGRLLPEYRPAGSPSFISHEHSNSHRKVLEMRRQKSEPQPPETNPDDQNPQIPFPEN